MVTMTIPVKRLVVRVRCPVPGPPRSESWHGSGSAGRPVGVGRCIGFAVVMAQVRRPVPFRTRKLRPGRGDGTALERVWESSAPPHSTLGVPVELRLREPPFLFVVPACRLEPGPRGFRANGQRKLLDFSPCVSYVKALRLVLWQELRCMTLQRRRVCLPRRSPSPSGIPTK